MNHMTCDVVFGPILKYSRNLFSNLVFCILKRAKFKCLYEYDHDLEADRRRIKDSGIDNVFVCSHGYGTPDHNQWGLQMGHFHGCSEGMATGLIDTSIMDSWTSHGDIEDGWQAIHYAIRDVPSSINGKNLSNTCKTLGKSMVNFKERKKSPACKDRALKAFYIQYLLSSVCCGCFFT